jgi:hypothetical protein
MRVRLTKLAVALAALAALAVGGSALANAAQSKGHASKAPAVKVQKAAVTADQPTPGDTADVAGESATETADTPGAADADTLQQGDQSAPDTAAESATESASESASETGPSDGPGGYEDTSPTADTQQQGEH